MGDAYEKMDRMYKYQKYIYDFTRKYYLLGRDDLIEKMPIEKGQNVLEIGCGTGRNLEILAKKYPQCSFYGLDASAEMLVTADKKFEKFGLTNARVETALADDFNHQTTFGLDEPFDIIFFSYSISMIPTWQESFRNALENTKREMPVFIVDFFDQRDLPQAFSTVLKAWLRQFHVKYPKELIPFLDGLEEEGLGQHRVEPIFKSYAFISEFTRSAA